MRLLLDECTPAGLIQFFVGVEVDHVTAIGWSGTKNGKLLAHTNRLADLAPLIKLAIKQAHEAKPGEVRHIQ